MALIRTVGVALGRDATRLQKKLHGWTLARLGKIGSFPMTIRLTPQTPVPGAVTEMATALLRHQSRIPSGLLCVSSGLRKTRNRDRRLGPCLTPVRSLQQLESGSSHSSASFWP